jgi:hypothetical protein
MKRGSFILTFVLVLATIVFAADFKPYPGAKIDYKATKEANEAAQAAKMSNVKATIYTTKDSFQNVSSFYKGIATEYMMPRSSGTTGKPKKYESYDLYEAFFVLTTRKIFPTRNSGSGAATIYW